MSDFPSLFAAALERPAERGPRLVLADWLEETGEATNAVRAELLRLQVEREATEQRKQARLDRRAREILEARPDLLAVLGPILNCGDEPLALNPALVTVLGAGVQVLGGGIEAGSVWVGHLHQPPSAYSTVLTIRTRDGNAIEGDMHQDFGPNWGGDFFFRGVVACRSRLTFATYRGTGGAAWPGLYQLTLKPGGWLNGTWRLPPGDYGDRIRLRRRPEE